MSAWVGRLSLEQLAWVTAALILPGALALLVLGGEPWRLLDRPLFTGGLSSPTGFMEGEVERSLVRGLVVSMVLAVLMAGAVVVGLARRRATLEVLVPGAAMMTAAGVVLVPLSQAFWLADGVDASRLSSSVRERGVALDLFSMTGSEWAQAAPYMLLTLYAIAAFVTVLGLVGLRAQEERRARLRHRYSQVEGWSSW